MRFGSNKTFRMWKSATGVVSVVARLRSVETRVLGAGFKPVTTESELQRPLIHMNVIGVNIHIPDVTSVFWRLGETAMWFNFRWISAWGNKRHVLTSGELTDSWKRFLPFPQSKFRINKIASSSLNPILCCYKPTPQSRKNDYNNGKNRFLIIV